MEKFCCKKRKRGNNLNNQKRPKQNKKIRKKEKNKVVKEKDKYLECILIEKEKKGNSITISISKDSEDDKESKSIHYYYPIINIKNNIETNSNPNGCSSYSSEYTSIKNINKPKLNALAHKKKEDNKNSVEIRISEDSEENECINKENIVNIEEEEEQKEFSKILFNHSLSFLNKRTNDKQSIESNCELNLRNDEENHSSISKSNSSLPYEELVCHYPIGEKIGNYKLINHIDDGTFGSVYKCENIHTHEIFAMKIITSNEDYMKMAKMEVDLIKKILVQDLNNESHVIKIEDYFTYQKNLKTHLIIIFELLGLNLYIFMKENNYQGYLIKQIQHIAKQILEGIDFIHSKGNILHTDLKPENILFKDSSYEYIFTNNNNNKKKNLFYKKLKSTEIKIIDFGSAVEINQSLNRRGIICTRQYRPPEVLLNCCDWDTKTDIWSIGCILYEMYTGKVLFPTHNSKEHLCLMEKICGKIPEFMIRNTLEKNLFVMFNKGIIKVDKLDKNYLEIEKALEEAGNFDRDIKNKHKEFKGLLKGLLEINPKKRFSARQALEHDFFKVKFSD